MENVKFVVEDLEKEKKSWLNNTPSQKLAEKLGEGHSIEFSIQDDVLTIRTTKKTFMAPIDEVTVTYEVNNYITTYCFRAKNGEKIGINRTTTYLDPDDFSRAERIIEQMPGYKGRSKANKVFLWFGIIGFIFWILVMIWLS